MALGFWEACGSHVGRMTLRGFGLKSNINGDRVWSRGAHFGIYALLLWGEARGRCVCFFFSMLCVPGYVLTSYLVDVEDEWVVGC